MQAFSDDLSLAKNKLHSYVLHSVTISVLTYTHVCVCFLLFGYINRVICMANVLPVLFNFLVLKKC